jgi:hypothetical protein
VIESIGFGSWSQELGVVLQEVASLRLFCKRWVFFCRDLVLSNSCHEVPCLVTLPKGP